MDLDNEDEVVDVISMKKENPKANKKKEKEKKHLGESSPCNKGKICHTSNDISELNILLTFTFFFFFFFF